MVSKNSRYRGLPSVSLTDKWGNEVSLLTPRYIVPVDGATQEVPLDVCRLDLWANTFFNDSTQWWAIADRAPELFVVDNFVGDEISVPTLQAAFASNLRQTA